MHQRSQRTEASGHSLVSLPSKQNYAACSYFPAMRHFAYLRILVETLPEILRWNGSCADAASHNLKNRSSAIGMPADQAWSAVRATKLDSGSPRGAASNSRRVDVSNSTLIALSRLPCRALHARFCPKWCAFSSFALSTTTHNSELRTQGAHVLRCTSGARELRLVDIAL